MSRASETRGSVQRDYKYTPPNEMDIPAEITAKFKEMGFRLRWVRILINGEEDYKNIGNSLKEGYVFVTSEEVEDSIPMARLFSTKNHKNLVTVGDIALAKIPAYKADARRRYYEGKAKELENIGKREIRGSDPRMNKLTPVFDESTTKVQVRQFAADKSEDE